MAIASLKLSNSPREEFKKSIYLIELTSKRWKGLLLVAIILGLLGLSLLFWEIWISVYEPLLNSGFAIGSSPMAGFRHVFTSLVGGIGTFLFFFSLALAFYAKFMAWWRHG